MTLQQKREKLIEEFDKRFTIFEYGSVTVDKEQTDEIKAFIRKNFIPKQELVELVEGMRENETYGEAYDEGYNQALDQLLEKISNDTK